MMIGRSFEGSYLPTECRAVRVRLIVWIGCASTVALLPLDFTESALSYQRVAGMIFEQNLSRRWVDIVANVLLFVPLGVALEADGQWRSWKWPSILTRSAVAAMLISLTFECLQLLLPSRFPSFLDVASNTVGALSGTYVSRHGWLAGAERALARVSARAARVNVVGVVVGYLTVVLVGSAALQARTRLNWEPTYPLSIGNERTADRPWRGRIFDLELTDRATSEHVVRQFAERRAVRLPGLRVLALDFKGAAPYRDASGHVPPLHWTGPPQHTTDGVALTEDAWLETHGAAAYLVQRLRKSNAFTVYVRAAADSAGTRKSRDRIASNSIDTGNRNWTLEQWGEDLVVRVRTAHTGANANRPELVIPAVFVDTQPRDILVTYDGSSFRAAIAGRPSVSRLELTPGSSFAALWLPHVYASELERYKVTYIGVLFVPLAVMVFLFARTRAARVAWSAASIAGLAIALEGTLALVSQRSLQWHNLITSAAVGTFAIVVANFVPMIIGVRTQQDPLPAAPLPATAAAGASETSPLRICCW